MGSKSLRFASISALVSLALLLALSLLPALAAGQADASGSTVASRLTQKIDDKQLVTLKGTVHRLATSANDRGAADASMPLERMQILLKRSDAQEAALKQLIQDMHTPGTASYHKWLTPDQFGKQFGPSDQDVATLSAWLATHGMNVTKVNAGRQTLEFTATAAQFEQTFHAQIHKYQVNGVTHYANASDPSIPAALSPVFGGFASLNNFPVKSHMKYLGKAQFNPLTHKSIPSWTIGQPGYIPDNVLAPGDFAVQYDLNPLYTAGTTGKGQTIAIINESNIDVSLVNRYRTLFGLPANTPNVIIDGNDPGIDGVNNPDGPNGASGEAYLDVEVAGAVAPAATVDLVIAADTALQSGLFLAAEHAVYGNVAPVLSMSFGDCEADLGTFQTFVYALWEQAAAQGQTVMLSAGDGGSAGCDNFDTQDYAVSGQAVSGFASTPWNVAVGGTDFYYSQYAGSGSQIYAQLQNYWNETLSNSTPTVSLQQRVPEQAWNDSQYGFDIYTYQALAPGTSTIVAGSGGASNCATGSPSTNNCAGYPKPAWQSGTGVPADGVRDLPDVSLFAANGGNTSYYPTCAEDGDCQPVGSGSTVQISATGGTSAASPAFAGIMALVNQKYGPQGQADFVLYPLAKQYPSAFNDVTVGTNSVPCNRSGATYQGQAIPPDDCIAVSNPETITDPAFGTAVEGQIGTGSTPEYNASTGYDLATGLGTIDANNLVTNWGNVKFTASAVTLNANPTTFSHGTAVTISGAVSPASSTGSVALMTTSTVPLQAGEADFPLSNGAYSESVSYLPGGTYSIYAMFSGDGTNGPSTSAKTQVVVTPENSVTSLYGLQNIGNGGTVSVKNGATIPYGTQVVLSGLPGPSSGNINDTNPTGAVIFSDNGTPINTAQVDVAGEAEFNAAFAPGSHSVTAAYSGDASYNASASAPLTFTVAKDPPAILLSSGSQTTSTITASPGTTSLTVLVENFANNAAQSKTGAAYATPAAPPTGVVTLTGLPGGTLTFPALAAATDPSTLFPDGAATIAVPAETAGTYTVTATYPGDANYISATQTFSVTIAAAKGIATTTTATASATTTSTAAAVSVTATVTGTTAGGFPSGTLTFVSSGYTLGQLTLPTSGTTDSVTEVVPLNTASLFSGSNQITVQYSGNSVYAPSYALVTVTNGGTPALSLSNNGAITVTAGGSGMSTITLTPSGGLTGPVALTCAVTPTTGTSVPSCTVNSPVTISGTTAPTTTLTVNTTAATTPGGYSVTVSATASGVMTATTVVALTVNGVGTTPTVALSNSAAITIGGLGQSGSSTITVTPGGGFTGSVALTCAVTPTNETDTPGCTVTSPVNITGTSAGMATLTVTTTSASGAMERPRTRMVPIGGGVAVATLLFFLVPIRRRKLRTLLGALVLTAVFGFSSGCGGGGSGGTTVTNPGTTTGSYTVTVSGTASGVTIAPVAVAVTLQ